MFVTSLSALAASVRTTLTWGQSNTGNRGPARPRKRSATPGTDTVELSKDRAGTLVQALDTDRDGVVTHEEFTDGAIELLKRASVRLHHLPARARKDSAGAQPSGANVTVAAAAIRRYTTGA